MKIFINYQAFHRRPADIVPVTYVVVDHAVDKVARAIRVLRTRFIYFVCLRGTRPRFCTFLEAISTSSRRELPVS